MVIKTIWYWLRDKREDQWNIVGVNDLSTIVYTKPKDPSFGDKNSLFTKTARKTGKQYGRN